MGWPRISGNEFPETPETPLETPLMLKLVSCRHSYVVPGQKVLFLEGQTEGSVQKGCDLLFEPDWEGLS